MESTDQVQQDRWYSPTSEGLLQGSPVYGVKCRFDVQIGTDVLLEVLEVLQHPKMLEKSEIFRLSEILHRRSEIFIKYFYRNVLFHTNMSLSELCRSFNEVTRIFSLPKVFCGPQICQNVLEAGDPPRTPLWSSRRSSIPLVG